MIEEGFCDYDEFESPDNRGTYNWTEQVVSSDPQPHSCFFGSQNQDSVGMARRTCEGNLEWGMYDGTECATADTFRLRSITNVSK